MSARLRPIIVALAAWLGLAAPAAASSTSWTCWLHGSTQVACTVIGATDAAEAARPVATLAPAELMRAVRARPATLAGQIVFVPLHGVPTDESLVQQLVSSVLCGARPDCAARYHTDLQQLIAHAPELFADMIDPVLGSTVL